jgi:hypothetical protein
MLGPGHAQPGPGDTLCAGGSGRPRCWGTVGRWGAHPHVVNMHWVGWHPHTRGRQHSGRRFTLLLPTVWQAGVNIHSALQTVSVNIINLLSDIEAACMQKWSRVRNAIGAPRASILQSNLLFRPRSSSGASTDAAERVPIDRTANGTEAPQPAAMTTESSTASASRAEQVFDVPPYRPWTPPYEFVGKQE